MFASSMLPMQLHAALCSLAMRTCRSAWPDRRLMGPGRHPTAGLAVVGSNQYAVSPAKASNPCAHAALTLLAVSVSRIATTQTVPSINTGRHKTQGSVHQHTVLDGPANKKSTRSSRAQCVRGGARLQALHPLCWHGLRYMPAAWCMGGTVGVCCTLPPPPQSPRGNPDAA